MTEQPNDGLAKLENWLKGKPRFQISEALAHATIASAFHNRDKIPTETLGDIVTHAIRGHRAYFAAYVCTLIYAQLKPHQEMPLDQVKLNLLLIEQGLRENAEKLMAQLELLDKAFIRPAETETDRDLS